MTVVYQNFWNFLQLWPVMQKPEAWICLFIYVFTDPLWRYLRGDVRTGVLSHPGPRNPQLEDQDDPFAPSYWWKSTLATWRCCSCVRTSALTCNKVLWPAILVFFLLFHFDENWTRSTCTCVDIVCFRWSLVDVFSFKAVSRQKIFCHDFANGKKEVSLKSLLDKSWCERGNTCDDFFLERRKKNQLLLWVDSAIALESGRRWRTLDYGQDYENISSELKGDSRRM